MKKIYILPSQHFDVIWRKSSEYYRQVRSRVLKKSLELLDKYPRYRFYQDQAEIIREFLKFNPQYLEKVKDTVKNGKFEICGGGEVLADSNMILGESIVRNLMYGRQWFKKYLNAEVKGSSFIDTFGMCGQLPQIMQKFGDKYFMAGRTPGGEGKYEYGDYGCFIWQGIDGSEEVSSVSALGKLSYDGMSGFDGYGVMEGFDKEYQKVGDNLDVAMHNIGAGLEDLKKVEGDIISTDYTGEEHTPSEALPILVDKFNNKCGDDYKYYIATPNEFFEKIDKSRLPVIKGEFNPVFTGCYATRIEIKKSIRACENSLLITERLILLSQMLGIKVQICNLADLWRKLNYVQFHDSICGCHIDESSHMLVKKLEEVLNETGTMRKKLMDGIANVVSSGKSIVFFNMMEVERKEVVSVPEAKGMHLKDKNGHAVPYFEDDESCYFIVTLPAMGFTVYSMEAADKVNRNSRFDAESFETESYHVDITPERLYVTDKLLGTRLDTDDIPLARIIYGEDSGNLWVERLTGKYVSEEVGKIFAPDITENSLYFNVRYTGYINKNDLKNEAWDGAEYLKWTKEYKFYKDMDKIDLKVVLDWKGKNSTVLMQYPCKFLSTDNEAVYEVPFGSQKREAYTPSYENNTGGTWPTLNSADLSDEKIGLTVANDGTPGYRIEDRMITVTMLRSGSDWKEPFFPFKPEEGSFDSGMHIYNISILPHEGSYYKSQAFKLGMKLNSKIGYAVTDNCKDIGDVKLISKNSFLNISEPNIVLSAFKISEDGNGYILRLYEFEGIKTNVKVGINVSYTRSVETNMMENEDVVLVDLNCLKFKPFEIKTIKLYL